MGKQSIAFNTEDLLKQMAENNMKLLFTTHGFKLLGITTYDKRLPDEATGARRRWVKGLAIEDGHPLPAEDRVFETLLDWKNPKTGKLEEVVAHEDDFVIVMERKTFEISDDEKNFQFLPNMHYMSHVQQMVDQIDEGRRRIGRLEEEKEQSLLDSDHFQREAQAAKEREKTLKELVNRLTREHAMMSEKIGNLESLAFMFRAKNLELEAFLDETTANATERGTIKGMTTDDMLIHASEKKKELYNSMIDIEPGVIADDESSSEKSLDMREELKKLTETVNKLVQGKQEQKAAT